MKLAVVSLLAVGALAADLGIDVTLPVECDRKTQKGDKIQVHYRGTLQSNGEKFDASYDRGTPLAFSLGSGMVIKGWDQGLLDMCIGEKRTLTVPPEYGYGQRAIGPIPAGSTLIFETELMGIAGVPQPESIVTKSTEAAKEAEETAEETAEATETEAAEEVEATEPPASTETEVAEAEATETKETPAKKSTEAATEEDAPEATEADEDEKPKHNEL